MTLCVSAQLLKASPRCKVGLSFEEVQKLVGAVEECGRDWQDGLAFDVISAGIDISFLCATTKHGQALRYGWPQLCMHEPRECNCNPQPDLELRHCLLLL